MKVYFLLKLHTHLKLLDTLQDPKHRGLSAAVGELRILKPSACPDLVTGSLSNSVCSKETKAVTLSRNQWLSEVKMDPCLQQAKEPKEKALTIFWGQALPLSWTFSGILRRSPLYTCFSKIRGRAFFCLRTVVSSNNESVITNVTQTISTTMQTADNEEMLHDQHGQPRVPCILNEF